MILYSIRHGDPVYGPEERLTEKGHEQAKALVPRLENLGITKIFASPLRRARQTAAPTAEKLGLPIEIEPWCSEDLVWKDFTYEKEADNSLHWVMFQQNTRFRSNGNFDLSNKDWTKATGIEKSGTPFEEAYKRIISGSDGFLARLGYKREGSVYRIERKNEEKVALFCHQGFMMVWMPFLLGIPPHLFWSSFDVTHTGIVVIEFKNNPDDYTAPRCLAWGDTSHLFKAGLELKYNGVMPF